MQGARRIIAQRQSTHATIAADFEGFAAVDHELQAYGDDRHHRRRVHRMARGRGDVQSSASAAAAHGADARRSARRRARRRNRAAARAAASVDGTPPTRAESVRLSRGRASTAAAARCAAAHARRSAAVGAAASAAQARRHRRGRGRGRSDADRVHQRRGPALHGEGRRDGDAALPRRTHLRRRRRAAGRRRQEHTPSRAAVTAASRSVAIIINPIAGGGSRGAADANARLAQAIADGFSVSAEVFVTDRTGHARELAKAAAGRGAELVMAWGGDGTINEVASALVGSDVALGIVPAGSGNGLARELGIDARPRIAIADALRATPRPIDVGDVEGRYFVNTAGVGFDAHVASRFAVARRRGFLGYANITARALTSYVSLSYRITI